jgi:hypothetical protein
MDKPHIVVNPNKGNGPASPSAVQYAHRSNYDGTLDSICKLCYLTVARAYRESDLSHLELRHVCQPVERRRATRIAHRIFDPGPEQRQAK